MRQDQCGAIEAYSGRIISGRKVELAVRRSRLSCTGSLSSRWKAPSTWCVSLALVGLLGRKGGTVDLADGSGSNQDLMLTAFRAGPWRILSLLALLLLLFFSRWMPHHSLPVAEADSSIFLYIG